MGKYAKWRIGCFVGGMFMAAVALFAQETIAPTVYGVATVGYNYREKPIYWFGVQTQEGKCGNFASAKQPGSTFPGGGAVAYGCSIRVGETATVKWQFDRTSDEYDQHVPPESHEVKVAIPQPQSRRSRYLQVHFLADNHVVLDWRDDIDNRLNPKTGKIDEQQH